MIRRPTSELSIKPKMSRHARGTLIAVGILGSLLALYYAYTSGVAKGHQRVGEDKALIAQLNDTISQLRTTLETAQEKLIVAQRHRQIQDEAYQQINVAYASSERKNSYLGSRLDFYRSIISPEDGKAGPSIQGLTASIDENLIKFDVTLVQAIKHSTQVRGTLRVSLVDAGVTLSIWPDDNVRSVSFQYFQQFSGVLPKSELSDSAKLVVEFSLTNGEQILREFGLTDVLSIATQ